MLPWGGGWGDVWLKNNVVPTLGQHLGTLPALKAFRQPCQHGVPNPYISLLLNHLFEVYYVPHIMFKVNINMSHLDINLIL